MTESDDLRFNPDHERALKYFRGLPDYEPTRVTRLALRPDVTVLAKDETERMGLGAFKALGGPYAIARLLADDWAAQTGNMLDLAQRPEPEVRAFARTRTFVTASAGNHGLGVAAGAAAFGANARVYLCKTVPDSFARRLEALGAEVVRAGDNYDDSVTEAIADARRTSATLLADGTWPGYTAIPKLVMEGYTVIAEELRNVFETANGWPTHVYLQAGVGGLAAAMAHMIRKNWAVQPELIVVEPAAATCLRDSHLAGKVTRAEGPDSNMGRLDCKEPSIVAWQTLERSGVSYVALTEEEGAAAAKAVTDLGIPTTPSGAAGFGAMLREDVSRSADAEFRPLIIVTEGPA
jgi:diaminopropionate ammonia-lyase